MMEACGREAEGWSVVKEGGHRPPVKDRSCGYAPPGASALLGEAVLVLLL